jgi:hypothetical protein
MMRSTIIATLAATLLLAPSVSRAHCDTLDGPVVGAAKKAVESGNANLVLVWVRKQDEAEVREKLKQTLLVRKLSPEARALADTAFFETVVRVHRAGEGAPYEGLKPAGQDLGPAVPAGDQALAKGTADALETLLVEAVRHGLREQFAKANSARTFKPDDVEAGRRYVAAYVSYIHWVEGVYQVASQAEGHHEEGGHAPEGAHHGAEGHGTTR